MSCPASEALAGLTNDASQPLRPLESHMSGFLAVRSRRVDDTSCHRLWYAIAMGYLIVGRQESMLLLSMTALHCPASRTVCSATSSASLSSHFRETLNFLPRALYRVDPSVALATLSNFDRHTTFTRSVPPRNTSSLRFASSPPSASSGNITSTVSHWENLHSNSRWLSANDQDGFSSFHSSQAWRQRSKPYPRHRLRHYQTPNLRPTRRLRQHRPTFQCIFGASPTR